MNGNKLLVDTNIILYLVDKDDLIESELNNNLIYISFITELELLSYHGLSSNEQKIIRSLISDCLIVDINNQIKEFTILLRKRYRLKLSDSIIAATANFLNIPLLSADSDFKKVNDISFQFYSR